MSAQHVGFKTLVFLRPKTKSKAATVTVLKILQGVAGAQRAGLRGATAHRERVDDGEVLGVGAHHHADRPHDGHGAADPCPRAGRQHRPARLVHARVQNRGLMVGRSCCSAGHWGGRAPPPDQGHHAEKHGRNGIGIRPGRGCSPGQPAHGLMVLQADQLSVCRISRQLPSVVQVDFG